MPVTTGLYKCRTCGEEFKGVSGKGYGEYDSCSCGDSMIQVDPVSGYSYRSDTNLVDILESDTVWSKEDFVEVTEKAQEYLTELERIKAEAELDSSLHVYKSYKKGENGQEYLDYLSITYGQFQSLGSSLAQNEVSLIIRFTKMYGNSTTPKEVEERLGNLLNIMNKVESGELDVSSSSQFEEIAVDMQLEVSAQQLEEYDYTMHV